MKSHSQPCETRTPQSCEFRKVLPNGEANCGLAQRVVGNGQPIVTTAEHCEHCCREPLEPGRLSPTVASLVYRATLSTQKTCADHVHSRQTQFFAERWLGGQTITRIPKLDVAKKLDRAPRGKPRVGLVGDAIGFGVACQNQDIAKYLDIDRWLSRTRIPDEIGFRGRRDTMSREMSGIELEAWLNGLDAILFVEFPRYSFLTKAARQLGIKIICVPNWEQLHPGQRWLEDIDLMICPTKWTKNLLSQWKERFGFGWHVDDVSWPIDRERFHFRLRMRCKRFVYIDGSGGMTARDEHGDSLRFARKGMRLMTETARRLPGIPFLFFTKREKLAGADQLANVEIAPLQSNSADLYSAGDVCVLPSHWEGLGLPHLECQAAGMPLITTDAAPMNEHRPLAKLPVREFQPVYLDHHKCIAAAMMQPDEVANVLRNVYGTFIGLASFRAGQFIRRSHCWKKKAKVIQAMIDGLWDVDSAPAVAATDRQR